MLFLTSKDYDILNRKISDLWEEVQGLKRRVRELEDAKKKGLADIDDVRISEMVMAWHPVKGWLKGCVMEKSGPEVFVVCGTSCIWTDKVKKIEK